jgi:formate dehydrogenase major subunit
MGSFPHELSGYRHISDDGRRAPVRGGLGRHARRRAGPAHPQHARCRARWQLPALYVQGEDILQSDPNTHHVAAGLKAMELVIVHDLFLNETANYAHVFLPGSDLP